MMNPRDIFYDLADNCLPDTHANGMDGPDTMLAKEVVGFVLDRIFKDTGKIVYVEHGKFKIQKTKS